jgi:hypothetical protein
LTKGENFLKNGKNTLLYETVEEIFWSFFFFFAKTAKVIAFNRKNYTKQSVKKNISPRLSLFLHPWNEIIDKKNKNFNILSTISLLHIFLSNLKLYWFFKKVSFWCVFQESSLEQVFTAKKYYKKLWPYIKWRFFVVAALLIKVKQQHGKNQNKNTGLFINCMDFVVVRTKINKK